MDPVKKVLDVLGTFGERKIAEDGQHAETIVSLLKEIRDYLAILCGKRTQKEENAIQEDKDMPASANKIETVTKQDSESKKSFAEAMKKNEKAKDATKSSPVTNVSGKGENAFKPVRNGRRRRADHISEKKKDPLEPPSVLFYGLLHGVFEGNVGDRFETTS